MLTSQTSATTSVEAIAEAIELEAIAEAIETKALIPVPTRN